VLASDVPHGGLDEAALARYFAFGFVPAPRTAFSNVRALRPGERLVVTADGTDRETYYTPRIARRSSSLDGAARGLRSRVERAVERRLMADVPLGAFLSGGIDSSVVVGTMAQLSEEPVRTFTVGFDESRFDESWAAREVAEYHDTDHHERTVTADEVRELVPEVLGRLGQPFADQSLLPTYVVARETSDRVKVALSGDGADELFAGYDKYLGEYYSRYYRAVPGPVRRGVVEPLVAAVPAERTSSTGELARKLRKFTRGGESDTPARHAGWLRVADAETDRAYPTLDVGDAAPADLRAEHDALDGLFLADRDERDALGDVLAVDTRYSLPNQMLRKVDLASMYNSLEVRVPFLDTGVVEYAMSLPTSHKMTARGRKRALKRAFDDVLPESILTRSKQGFDMPIGEWFRGPLATEFEDRTRGLDTHLVDARAVGEIHDAHRGGEEHGKFLWTVYVFGVWLERMREQGVLPP
jgi:asparagine synthase (glutamine-hydrolysing)